MNESRRRLRTLALAMSIASGTLMGGLAPRRASAVDPQVTTIAGNGMGFTDSAVGTTAQFRFPVGIEKVHNDLYVVDSDNDKVRRVGVAAPYPVSTLSGTVRGYLDGPASVARFAFPSDIAWDGSLTLYVTDGLSKTIRRVSLTNGSVGSVVPLQTFSGFPAGVVYLSQPTPRLIVSDSNQLKQIIISNGQVLPFAGGTDAGFVDSADPLSARFNAPYRMVKVGNAVYVAENGNNVIRRVELTDALAAGPVTTFAGTGAPGAVDGPRLSAQFRGPVGLDADDAGNLYVADFLNHRIRRISAATGNVCTMAGTGAPGLQDGFSNTAQFQYPHSITVDGASGTAWVTDNSVTGGAHVVRRIDPVTDQCGNRGPIARADSASTDEDTAVSIDVLANDVDLDRDALTAHLESPATNGRSVCDGSACTYTPNPNFNGTDRFRYSVADGRGGTAVADVEVTVRAVNDPPSIEPIPSVTGDEGAGIDLSAVASDVDGDALSFTWSVTGPCELAAPTTASTQIRCLDNGTFALSVAADDGVTTTTRSSTVSVGNVVPAVTVVKPASGSTIEAGTVADLEATFADPGTLDTHACSVDWGDGEVEAGVVSAGTCSASHVYETADAGSRMVSVTVTDDDGAEATRSVAITVRAPSAECTEEGSSRCEVKGEGVVQATTGSFSFELAARIEGTRQIGHLHVRNGNRWRFRSSTVQLLHFGSATEATWAGDGTLDGAAGYTFTARVGDNRSGHTVAGDADTVRIEIRNGSGAVVHVIDGSVVRGDVRIR